MPIPFIMPKFDMDQEKATIVSWSKEEGESIQAEETALVVETEKVAIDVPAPATGTLAGIRFQAGDTVPVTTVIAYILQEGETLADLPSLAEPAAVFGMHPAEPVSDQVAASAAATPVAARLAKEKGVDLSRVSTKGERITRQDVERYLTIQTAPATPAAENRVIVPATPAARRQAREAGVRLESVPGSGPRGRVQAADISMAVQRRTTAALVLVKGRPAQVVPLVGMRQKIAERMTASFHDIPHISLTVEADISALEATRTQLSAIAEKDRAGKVSLTAMLAKVVAWALERNPYVNASLQGGQIYLWQDVNLGIATAVPEGLIVPVIHQANRKSIREISLALQDLTARAKEGRLTLEEVQQGTFTITNLGMYGVRQFRAVINPPESAILAIGAVVRKPVVINDRDEVAVRPTIAITISADHRVIDGVVAARFLADLVQGIQLPGALLY